MHYVLWEFKVKSNKLQWFLKNIHFTVRKEALHVQPSPCAADLAVPVAAPGLKDGVVCPRGKLSVPGTWGSRTSTVPHTLLLCSLMQPGHLLFYCIIIISVA